MPLLAFVACLNWPSIKATTSEYSTFSCSTSPLFSSETTISGSVVPSGDGPVGFCINAMCVYFFNIGWLAATNDGGEKSVMTEEEKEALRKSFAGKAVSQMTPEERKLFDEEFQYGFGNQTKQKPTVANSPLPAAPTGSTMSFLKRMNLVVKK